MAGGGGRWWEVVGGGGDGGLRGPSGCMHTPPRTELEPLLLPLGEPLESLDQVIAHGAADAAVEHLDHLLLRVLLHVLAEQRVVDADLAELPSGRARQGSGSGSGSDLVAGAGLRARSRSTVAEYGRRVPPNAATPRTSFSMTAMRQPCFAVRI